MAQEKKHKKAEVHQVTPQEAIEADSLAMARPDPCWVVIFGASGDLAARKLIPALFNLYKRDLLPETFKILGCARSQMSDEVFRNKMDEALKTYVPSATKSQQKDFIKRCFYLSGDYQDPAFYKGLSQWLTKADKAHGSRANHLFYLSTPPSLIDTIVSGIGEAKLAVEPNDKESWTHIIVEKPFGRDLESAMELDRQLHCHLSEDQIYRIDHYLGKETVQSILMFRFANAIFEPITNRRYVDNVQITVAESVGVEDRAGYYEQAGLVRDMFQNHMLQVLALVAMEPPASFQANRVRDEKVKLLRAVRPFSLGELDDWIVRGQYGAGMIDGKQVLGYREEKGVAPDSRVETFVAAKLYIDNWRWKNVPFYLRSGKRLARRVSEIAITFKGVPHSLFQSMIPTELEPNVMVLNIQPDEGLTMSIQAKRPGPRTSLATLDMAFKYRDLFGEELTEAYERLILDCMLGDQTLFVRHDDLEVSWSLITPLLQAWEEEQAAGRPGQIFPYRAGSWGPREAALLIERDERRWRKL